VDSTEILFNVDSTKRLIQRWFNKTFNSTLIQRNVEFSVNSTLLQGNVQFNVDSTKCSIQRWFNEMFNLTLTNHQMSDEKHCWTVVIFSARICNADFVLKFKNYESKTKNRQGKGNGHQLSLSNIVTLSFLCYLC
jgi:hypothetical protein